MSKKRRKPMASGWLAAGWVLPDGDYITLGRNDHKTVAAILMDDLEPFEAFDRAIKEGWIRVGDVTIQLPGPKNEAFLRARDHVRMTSAMNAWDIHIEWWQGTKVVSYTVPILEFMNMESIADLGRYPKEIW